MNDNDSREGIKRGVKVVDRPFVSFCMTSYNQREYALLGLAAALAQDYPNMEIIVSDDASTDGSASALLDYVNTLPKSTRTVKVLTSPINCGVQANYEKLFNEARGELIIGADGDDISEPSRVRRIVEEWVKGGKKATVIFHDGWKIDGKGKVIGRVGRRTVDTPLGACMAYSPKVVSDFPPGEVKGGYQDHILGRRGSFIGDSLFIPECLVRYRVGSGDSSVLTYRRGPELRSARARVAGFHQSLLDIEYCRAKGLMTLVGYEKLRKEYLDSIARNQFLIQLIDGRVFRERLSAYKNLYRGSFKSGLLKMPYLLPRFLGDFLYGCYDIVRIIFLRRRYSKCRN